MDIIILCGGLSSEREVSLVTGSLVTAALRRRGHRAVAVDVYYGMSDFTDPESVFAAPWSESSAVISDAAPEAAGLRSTRRSQIGPGVMELCLAADIVFMALHGDIGENGKLQALFDLYGVKYTGTGSVGSMLAMDKGLAKDIFLRHGIRTPQGVALHKGGEIVCPGLPCVVKPMNGGSSVGTSIARTDEEFAAAVELAFTYEDNIIAENYISGRECDVGVLAGRALPVIEICPKSGFYDYKNKYQSGLTDEYCPADLPADVTERLQQAALDVFKALRLEVYARMDFIVDGEGQVWCLEANTLPGLTGMSLMPQEAAAAGISYEELLEEIIAKSMEKYA